MPDGIMWSVLQAPGLSFSNNRVPADCAGGTDIGRVTATCTERHLMQIEVITKRVDAVASQLFWFGCQPPKQSGCGSNTWVATAEPTDIDGTFRSAVMLAEVLECRCSKLYWAVCQAGSFRDLARDQC